MFFFSSREAWSGRRALWPGLHLPRARRNGGEREGRQTKRREEGGGRGQGEQGEAQNNKHTTLGLLYGSVQMGGGWGSTRRTYTAPFTSQAAQQSRTSDA